MSVEGHYRLISHNEKAEAIYARLADTTGAIEWVRNWREATTFLTLESAQLARDTARMDDASREVDIAQRFKEWKKTKDHAPPKSAKGKRAKASVAKKRASKKKPKAESPTIEETPETTASSTEGARA